MNTQINSSPLVSVIIPVYNAEPYLAKCLASLCGQTLQNMEFIIVDDCSTDGSVEIARQFVSRDRRFRILEGEKNQGEGPSRNRGMEAARGKYFGFVDPDDWVAPDYFQLLYEKAIEESADVVRGNCYYAWSDKIKQSDINDSIHQCLHNGRWPGLEFRWGAVFALYRTELVRLHGISCPTLRNGTDCVFVTNVLIKTRKFALENRAVYYYFQRDDSASHTVTEEYYNSTLRSIEIRGKAINETPLPEIDKITFWHNLFKAQFKTHLPRSKGYPLSFHVDYFTRAKQIFLSSGLAREVCSTYPSAIYCALLEKSPEEIASLWRQPKPSTSSRRKKTSPAIAACAWRYPVYRRRFWCYRILSWLTLGNAKRRSKNKREAYRQLLRDIRSTVQKEVRSRNLPW